MTSSRLLLSSFPFRSFIVSSSFSTCFSFLSICITRLPSFPHVFPASFSFQRFPCLPISHVRFLFPFLFKYLSLSPSLSRLFCLPSFYRAFLVSLPFPVCFLSPLLSICFSCLTCFQVWKLSALLIWYLCLVNLLFSLYIYSLSTHHACVLTSFPHISALICLLSGRWSWSTIRPNIFLLNSYKHR